MAILKNAQPVSARAFDAAVMRAEFPILQSTVHGKPLVYLDNAATTQKPNIVIDAIQHYYREDNANIHRGVHLLSQRATEAYESARETIGTYFNASSSREIVFVRGATEGINLVAAGFRKRLKAGDEVLISEMEHHSNIVPWQLVCEETGALLCVIPMTDAGDLRLDVYEEMLNDRVRIVGLTHVSNALGTVNPVRRMIELAHAKNIPVLIDGAQAAAHMRIDVKELNCDYYVVSAHKMFGPTGIGILYGKESMLEQLPPYQGGGDMIRSVTFEKTLFNDLPHRLEAGTPHIAGGIGFGVAIRYLAGLPWDEVIKHEHDLMSYAEAALGAIPGVRFVGTAKEKTGVVSFTLENIHPHDIGTILDQNGVAIRTGHHCAQPVMQHFGIPATARASFALYNTRSDVDALVEGLHQVAEVFG
jgi:cysteine desulfurase/selenocysteine lyase